MAADPGPIILTRAELQRRTRERSRLAAAKVAEEHGKVSTRGWAEMPRMRRSEFGRAKEAGVAQVKRDAQVGEGPLWKREGCILAFANTLTCILAYV